MFGLTHDNLVMLFIDALEEDSGPALRWFIQSISYEVPRNRISRVEHFINLVSKNSLLPAVHSENLTVLTMVPESELRPEAS